MSERTQDVLDANYAEQVRAARRMTPDERVLAGLRMFDAGCDAIRLCIREHFPRASDSDVERMLRVILRYAEDHDIL